MKKIKIHFHFIDSVFPNDSPACRWFVNWPLLTRRKYSRVIRIQN